MKSGNLSTLYNTLSLLFIIILISSAILSLFTLLHPRDYNSIIQVGGKTSESGRLSGAANAWRSEEQKPTIQICCSLSPDKVGNEGTGLTYRIIGASPAAEQAVHNAISDWANNVRDLRFIELKSSDNSAADITIKFNSSQAKMPKEIRLPDNTNNKGIEVVAPGASRIHVNLVRVITGVETTIAKSAYLISLQISLGSNKM